MLKFLEWAFSITHRHRSAVDKFEESLGGKIMTALVTVFFAGLSLGGEFFWLKIFYNENLHPDQLLEYNVKLIALGILVAALLLATLDYVICFIYVGIRTTILGDDYGGSRFTSFFFALLQLALGAATIIGAYMLAVNYTAWF